MEPDTDLVECLRSCIELNSVAVLRYELSKLGKKAPEIINEWIPNYGMSLLHIAVGLSQNKTVTVIKLLLDHGGEPNNTDCDESVSPLHLSIFYGFDAVFDILLRNGGDPLVQDGDGKSCYELVEGAAEIPLKHRDSMKNALISLFSDQKSFNSSPPLLVAASSSPLDSSSVPELRRSHPSNCSTTNSSECECEYSKNFAAATASGLPSPTCNRDTKTLEIKVYQSSVPLPRTYAAVRALYSNPFVLAESETNYSSELKSVIQDFSLVYKLKFGDLQLEFVQDFVHESPKKCPKGFYNYVLLNPKIVRRTNFSGNVLKSDVVNNSNIFRKFVSAIFYVGTGYGTRPIQHLVDAKRSLKSHRNTRADLSETIMKILNLWQGGSGVIVHTFFHHSSEREVNTYEAAMSDAMGLSNLEGLSNLKRGTYSGNLVSNWTQKQKNQFGIFCLKTSFVQFAVKDEASRKATLPHDVHL